MTLNGCSTVFLYSLLFQLDQINSWLLFEAIYPIFLFWTHKEFKRKSRKASFDQWLFVTTPLLFRTKLILNWLHTHFNFKVNFSCLIRNHLQSNLLRRNLFNRSKGAISVDFGTWYNNIVIMFGFFNFVIALVAIVFYTSNGQPL